MEYKFTKLPKSEIEIEIAISFAEFEPHVKRAAALLSEENEIEGFRKGKAPYDIVRQRFGEMLIYERAADLAVKRTYPEIFLELRTQNLELRDRNQAPIAPIGRPEITVTKLAPRNDFEYKAKIAVLPEVKLGDYKIIAKKVLGKERKEIEVSEEEIKKAVDWLRESRTKLITVDRPAEIGDRVEVDFSARGGSASGGEIGNKNPILAESQNHPLILGRNKFMPGFEDEIAGMKQGEEKSFTLRVPDDWREKSVAGRPSGRASPLAGKALEFKVKLNLVQKREMPELNDEFVKSLGEFSSVELLQKNIREGIAEEKKDKERDRLRGKILEEITKNVEIEVPEVLVEAEIDKMSEELKSGILGVGMKWEDYLTHIKKTADDLRKELREQATVRVRVALVLGEISRVEKIEPSAEEIKERADKFLERFKTAEQAEKNIDPEELREYTRGILRNEKVLEFLEEI